MFTGPLTHNGYCLPEYTVISDIALTKDNPLRCELGEGGGQWIGPDNTIVQCDESSNGTFTCSQSSDNTNITLYKRQGAHVQYTGKNLYTCNGSKENISIQIESKRIFLNNYFVIIICTDNTVLSAIYIEPPADIRSIPQSYKIHCITTGWNRSNSTVGIYLERHGQSYYNAQIPAVLGYNQEPPCVHTLNITNLTYYDYSEEVVWRADRVEFDQTEFNEQGLTNNNGDHDWACGVHYSTKGYDDLQTYIRGEQSYDSITIMSLVCFSS